VARVAFSGEAGIGSAQKTRQLMGHSLDPLLVLSSVPMPRATRRRAVSPPADFAPRKNEMAVNPPAMK
jgi:hypothetical protein